jgi:Tol biopolymer transport system component/DNA-binding winged helix-turn-helix (wHTH) protein
MTGLARHGAVYQFGTFRLDARRRSLARAGGTPVPLTAKVFDALLYLVEHAGALVSRDELTKALWPKTVVEENNLNVTISALRRALGEDAAGRGYIVTVAGRGYQFVAEVRSVDSDVPSAAAAGLTPKGPDPRTPGSAPFGVRPWWLRGAAAAVVVAVLVAGWLTREQRTSHAGDAASIGSVSRVSLVTTFTGREQTPALSPDGTQVAFAWDGGGENQDIYVLRIGAQQPLRLTQDAAPDHSPAWSPDGSQIAFVRQHDLWSADVVVVPALGGAERKLQSIRVPLADAPVAFTGPLLAWSPDGAELVFTTQVNESGGFAHGFALQRLSLADGMVRPLELAGEGYDTSPACSADASRLAFARYDAVTRDAELMVQELGPGLVPRGEPHPVPGSKLENPRSPAWSPDGRRLVFAKGSRIVEWTSGAELRTVHAAAGWLTGLSVAWRRDRPPVAVAANVEDDFDIWALPLDPDTRVAIGPPQVRMQSTARDWHPRFSPDGRHIAFTSWRGGGADIWIADADGRNARQLSRIGAADPGVPRWAPDGALLSFVAFAPESKPHTYLVNPSEGLPILLTDGSVSDWARDGEHLYVTELGSLPRVVRYTRAGGSREPLTDGGAAQETADGERLLYARPDAPGIFARSVHGGPEERLVEDYAYPPSAGFQPVQGGFYYVSYTPDARARAFRFYDDVQRSAHDVAPVPANAGVVWGLTVSPDGRELLFGAPAARADIVLLEF